MKKVQYIILVCTLLVVSCRKQTELPQSDPGNPVFFFTGMLNGNKVAVNAGDDGYYMHTSVAQDEHDIYVYRGDLFSACSSACGYSLTILINDDKVSLRGSTIQADSALHIGDYEFLDRSNFPTVQTLTFVPKDAYVAGSTYSWQIWDANGKVESSNSYSFTTALQIATDYTVNYSFVDVSGVCQGSLSSVYRPGAAFRTWMITNKNGNEVTLNAATDNPGDYVYSWEFGDGSSATGKSVTHTYANAAKYQVKLTTTRADNVSAKCIYEVNTVAGSCETNFIAKFAPIDYSKILKTITFILTDPSGVEYSTLDAGIGAGSKCEVLSVEEYDANQMGKPTKRLHLRFNCKLKNGSNEINLTEGEASIGVAY